MTAEQMVPLVLRLDRRYRVRGTDEERAAMAVELARKLARFDVPIVTQAVEQHIDAEPFSPTPNQLLQRCLDLTRETARRTPRRAPEIRGGPLTPLAELVQRERIPLLKIVRDDAGAA